MPTRRTVFRLCEAASARPAGKSNPLEAAPVLSLGEAGKSRLFFGADWPAQSLRGRRDRFPKWLKIMARLSTGVISED